MMHTGMVQHVSVMHNDTASAFKLYNIMLLRTSAVDLQQATMRVDIS